VIYKDVRYYFIMAIDLYCEAMLDNLTKCQAKYAIISGRYGIMLGLNILIFIAWYMIMKYIPDKFTDKQTIWLCFGLGFCFNLIAITLLIR
jgi:hypothetical protein